MSKENNVKIFLVDDDALFLKSMEIELLQHFDFQIETYPTGELCLANLSLDPDIIILDYFLDSVDKNAMNGIDVLDAILAKNPKTGVIMLSCQDKIDVAINCMHHKAIDYVVKSETAFLRINKIISSFLENQKLEKTLNWYMERA